MFQIQSNHFIFRFLIAVAIVIITVATLQSYPAPQSLAAGNIMLYTDATSPNGNLGGRAGADAACQAMSTKPTGFLNYRAFLSVAAPDEIQDMPANYGVPTNLPIVGSGGTIANDWADLLDGTIALNLQTAIGTSKPYWTGSKADGSLKESLTNPPSPFNSSGHCGNWTVGNIGDYGGSGDETATGGLWLDNAHSNCANTVTQATLLCIAYARTLR